MINENTDLKSEVKKYKKWNTYLIMGLIVVFLFFTLASTVIYQSYEYDDYSDLISIHPPSDIKPKYDTWAHRFLFLEEKYLNRHGGMESLEEFLSEVDARANHNPKTRQDVLNSLAVIGDVINNLFFYRYNTLLSHGLYSSGIDCDNRALLYLSAAEILGYKLEIVYLPSHAMVQWGTGDSVIYWETIVDEKHERTRDEIVKKHKLSDEIIKAAKYLKPLDENEILSMAYNNMSFFSWRQNMSKALWLNEKALEYDSDNYLALVMRSFIQVAETQSDEEIDQIRRLIDKDPNYSSTYLLLGDIYLSLNNYDLAIEYLEKSLSYNGQYQAYHLLKHAYRKKDQHLKAFGAYIAELRAREDREPLNDYTRGD